MLHSTTKLVLAGLLAGSLSACGGGGSVTTVADIVDMPVDAITAYDTNNDGFIDIDEAISAWDSLSNNDKKLLADAVGLTVDDIETIISNSNDVEIEVAVEDIIETIEEVAPVEVVEDIVEETTEVVEDVVEDVVEETTEVVEETTEVVEDVVEEIPTYTFSNGTTINNNGTGIAEDPFSWENYIPNGGVYDALNVKGLEAAHADGWTGKNVNVIIAEPTWNDHGESVKNIIVGVAPDATTAAVEVSNGNALVYE